jgi:pimeloyl-ACP methyl ester carboxylesterase
MVKKSEVTKSLLIIGIILMLFGTTFSSANILKNDRKSIISEKYFSSADFTKEIYEVQTIDKATITLTRYVGSKRPSIMLIHGMGVNHKIFDWDENHSLARFLNNESWDVWMLDLRTHDGDGDFIFDRNSDREYINRYWDFDKTLLKKDVVKAVDFIKEKSGNDTIFFMGHSYGGYLAYAYAEIIGNENLSGIITTGSSAYAVPKNMADNQTRMMRRFGIKIGNRAFVRPFGWSRLHIPKILILLMFKN